MSGTPIRVLVTAVGGDLGQALIKALRLAEADFEIFGCDSSSSGIGAAFVTTFETVPSAHNRSEYVYAIEDICKRHRIAAVLPASEAEIYVLAEIAPRRLSSAAIVCQSFEWLNTFGDKLKCMRVLSPHLPLAAFADAGDKGGVRELVRNVGFPVVVKARKSSGSKAVRLVYKEGELEACIAENRFSVVQEFIGDGEGEFSVGVFANGGFVDACAFRRELRVVGCSWFAETSYDHQVLDYALQFAHVSGLRGSANIQLRKDRGRVSLLEVNPRFSSLVAARSLCGFRDAEWSVLEALGCSFPPPSSRYRKIRFQRFFHEFVDSGEGYQAVAEWTPRQKAFGNSEKKS